MVSVRAVRHGVDSGIKPVPNWCDVGVNVAQALTSVFQRSEFNGGIYRICTSAS